MEGTHVDGIVVEQVSVHIPYVNYTDKKASQLQRVYSVLIDNFSPLTLAQISKATRIKSLTSIASRIRDIRTHGFTVVRTVAPNSPKGQRVFEYVID